MVFVPTKLHFFYIGTRVCLILFPKKRKDELDTPSAGEKFGNDIVVGTLFELGERA